MRAGLTQKGCAKRYDDVVERLGRLKERYQRVSGQYELRVERAQAAKRGSDCREAQASRASQPRPVAAARWERNDQDPGRRLRAAHQPH